MPSSSVRPSSSSGPSRRRFLLGAGGLSTAFVLAACSGHSAATTDAAGRYTVLGLTPGTYDLRVELQAFNTVVQRAQQFQVGQTITLDFRMKLGALSETVVVTSETPVVQTEASQLARVVRTEEVDALLKHFAVFPHEVFRKAREAIGR